MKRRILFTAISSLILPFSVMNGNANASTLIQESFSEAQPGGVTPGGWTATNPENVNIASSSGVLRQLITRPASGGGSSAIYYTGTSGEIIDGQMTNFDANVTIRFGGSGNAVTSLRGIVFRTQTTTLSTPGGHSGFWGYSLGVISTGDGRGLYLYENPTNVNSSGSGVLLGSAVFASDLLNNTDYLLKVSAQGENIIASLETIDGISLAALTYDQATVVQGYFGLRAAHANGSVNTYYNNLQLRADAIPEPGTAMLLMGGGLALMAGRRKVGAYLKGGKLRFF